MEVWASVTVVVVVGLLTIGSTIWATRTWGNRRGRVLWSFDAVPLLPDGVRAGLLSFTFRDIPVEQPHLVTVELANTGSKDVPSSAFDKSRSIEIAFGQVFYGVTGSSGGVQLVFPGVGASASEAIVAIKPHLLKRGETWSFTAVVAGVPKLSIESPLVDTDIQMATRAGKAVEFVVKFGAFGLSAEFPKKGNMRRSK